MSSLRDAVLVIVGKQVSHRFEAIAGPADHVEQHRMAHHETGPQRLRLGRDQPLEGWPAPPDGALRRLLAYYLAPLALVVASFGQRPLVIDDVLGGLHDDRAQSVEPGPAGATGDLVELPSL
jgi:hypothetical protein